MTSNANNMQVIQIIPKLYIIRKSGWMFRHRMFQHKIAETDVSAHSDRTSTIAETDVSALQRLQKWMFRHNVPKLFLAETSGSRHN